MGLYTHRDYISNSEPLVNSENRDEYFIIDALGTWIPECEIIYYGLLTSSYARSLHKLRLVEHTKPMDVYLNHSYFEGHDLIRYLSSADPIELDKEMTDETVNRLYIAAVNHYVYQVCTETAMRHAIIELCNYPFLKSITLVYPWDPRQADIMYMERIIPKKFLKKFRIIGGDIPRVIKATDITYTTIISNSFDDVNKMIDNHEEYRCGQSLFLLRNHSGNMRIEMTPDPNDESKKVPTFIEVGLDIILPKLVSMKSGIPLNGMRFGRFEPEPYNPDKFDPQIFI